jgi:tape measure domain-containing protein
MATGGKVIYEIEARSNVDAEFKKLDASVRSFNQTMKTVSNTLNVFKGLLAGYLTLDAGKRFLNLADAMSELNVQLKLLTGSFEAAKAVQEELFTVANKHGVAVQDLTKAYIGLAPTFSDLGKSQAEIITFTDNLIASYKLLGENSDQAMGSITQLAEAFKTGKVDMGLMNQVLGSNRLLMQAVAKEMNVTEKQLRTMAKTGKVSADELFKAVIKAGEEWQKKAAELPTGIGEAITILGNSFAKLAEKFTPVVTIIADGIKTITYGIEQLAPIVSSAWDLVVFTFTDFFLVTLPNLYDRGHILSLQFQDWLSGIAVDIGNGFIEVFNSVIEAYNNSIGKLIGKRIEPFELIVKSDAAQKEIEAVNKQIQEREDALVDYAGSLSKVEKATKNLLLVKPPVKPVLPEPPIKEKPVAEKDKSVIQKIVDDYSQLTKKRNESIDLWGEESNAAAEVGKEIEKLNINVNQMSLDANDAAGGFLNGIKSAANEIPTIADGFKAIGKSAFDGMTDSLTSFITKGKADFGKFFQDISAMLVKLGIQKALVAGIGSLFGGGFSKGGVFENGRELAFANGGVFADNRLVPFAKGGVVSQPTVFPFKNGVGLLGEAGSEAILPLHRGSDGSLGVKSSSQNASGNVTNVTVINNAKDTQTETKETTAADGTKNIEIFILSKVKEDFGKGGFDKVMQGNFGLNRQGQR